MKSLVKSMLPRALKQRVRQFLKEKQPESGAARTAAYKQYISLADPVYHPHLEDSFFSQALEKVRRDIESEIGHDPYGRAILFQLLKQTMEVEGDVIECGVHHGGGSHLMGFALAQDSTKEKTLWCLDSFQGLSEPGEEDIDTAGKSFFKKHDLDNVDFEQVRSLLEAHDCKVKVLKGWIPEVFSKVNSQRFAFAHIDVDLYRPIWDSLAFVYDRMSPGGIILLDDYGFPMLLGAKQATDRFFADKSEEVIPLPTGQAIVFKQKGSKSSH